MTSGKQRQQVIGNRTSQRNSTSSRLPRLRNPNQQQRFPRSWRPLPEPPALPHPNRPEWMHEQPTEVPLVFFDLETTGGNPFNSEVIEIAAVKEQNGKILGTYHTLVNPKRGIPRIVREITGIDNEMVRNAPTIQEVIDPFLEFIGNGTLVSHGALNDYAFIVEYARKLRQIEFKNFYICTHLLVSNYLPNIPNKKLSGLADYFGVGTPGAHRALADAEMTRDVFWKVFSVCEKNGFLTIEDLLKIQADNGTLNRLGAGLLARDAEKSPTTPGVIYLFNKTREVSYVTATSNIRRSLIDVTQLSEEREFNRLLVDVTDFKFERTAHFLDALLQEKRELKKLALPIDPRKYESRAAGFVQLLIPGDLVEYLAKAGESNWLQMPLAVKEDFLTADSEPMRHTVTLETDGFKPSDLGRHKDISDGHTSQHRVKGLMLPTERTSERNEFLEELVGSSELENVLPVRKARRLASTIRNPKFQYLRSPLNNNVVRSGHLQEGIGWFFGPFENIKAAKKSFDELVVLFPFDDSTLTFHQRVKHLEHLIRFLYGSLHEVKQNLESKKTAIQLFLNPKEWRSAAEDLKHLAVLDHFPLQLTEAELPKSGLVLISNNETKEMDIMVVLDGRIRKEAKLLQEQTDKLKSSRYFTRLFQPWDEEIKQPFQPKLFTEDLCAEVELFAYWSQKRKSEGKLEGEWVEFSKLAPLYDIESIG